jgi:hypothetical protein
MAIEDGAALGVLFSDLQSKDEIPDRLALFQRLRLNRVSAMQVFSSVGQDEAAKIADLVKPYVDGVVPSKFCPDLWDGWIRYSCDVICVATAEQYHDYNFTPNVLRDALEMLETYRLTEKTVDL